MLTDQPHFGLIVTDASPLITLAAGDALECLTIPGLPIIIPDMVYAEATRDLARLGARSVVLWARAHQEQATALCDRSAGTCDGAVNWRVAA